MTEHDPKAPSPNIFLREVGDSDIPIFFEQQLDLEANHMVAFTAKDPSDRAAFQKKWVKIRGEASITVRTIVYKGHVAGHILSYLQSGDLEVGYWIGKEYWGKGIATRALAELLKIVTVRPLHARTAKDNIASARVLQKCGFKITGEGKGFANARGMVVEEYIFRLE